MPPKNKGASKAKEAGSGKQKQQQHQQQSASSAATSSSPQAKPPQTIYERDWEAYWRTNPYQKIYEDAGRDAQKLSAADRQGFLLSLYLANNPKANSPAQAATQLSSNKKTQREFWKQVSELNIPLRRLPRPPPREQWRGGQTDKQGRLLADYTVEEYKAYWQKRSRLLSLKLESEHFKGRRKDRRSESEIRGGEEATEVEGRKKWDEEKEVEVERERRREMAALGKDLYGGNTDQYALDPEWDDVTPIPQIEPEGALAAIAYAEDYAEAMSYLRAVMAAEEHSPRCLKLTEHIISMNPAHYTVWLYRFAIVEALNISVPEELAWLNRVSLQHLKNYQIWHHRQLLMDHYYPSLTTEPERISRLAESERGFLGQMLAQDTKNYHVWSYRQYLVRKLGMWGDAERESVEEMIDDDVRNNSAWSHRFFVVFSDPAVATPGSHATEHDPNIPDDAVDWEVNYAREKIGLAPQNQSPWNYLKGVLVKGGRPLGTAREFCEGFVQGLGEDEEVVKSSHALDLLAEIYAEAGEKDRADLCLRRLGDKWDRIRKGYWEYRRKLLGREQELSNPSPDQP